MTRGIIVFAGLVFIAAPALAQEQRQMKDIEVVATTPLHGVGIDKNSVPYPVQTANSKAIEKSQSLDVSDYMARNLGSVHINQAQNNPLQPDLQYRGFTASPLLGNSQGLSVYMNGVRINEPFGDAVNWDVIPQSAISGINLIAGSNPLFGLNTLGGALSIKTKNGFTNSGNSVQAYGGSFNRRANEFESGGNDGDLSYFVTGNWFKESGWRDHSESDAKQLFSSFGWRSDNSELELTLAAADTDLNGNGSSPLELLKQDRKEVFTYPDNTQNELRMAALTGNHWLSDTVQFSGNAYLRKNDRDTFNGDGSDYGVIDLVVIAGPNVGAGLNENGDIIITADECGGACTAGDLVEEGEQVEDQNGNVVNPGLDDDEIAINNSSTTEQDGYGLGGQLTFLNDLYGHENQLITGFSFDQADVTYRFATEIAEFTEDRGTTGTGLINAESIVDAKIKTSTASLFFMDSFSVNDALTLTLSGRYNYSRINISGTTGDQPVVPAGESSTHTFTRFNPSAGLTYEFSTQVASYVSYSESSRVPTAAELTCHDQTNPCALPNSFLSDPPLDMVVAKTWEAGLRGAIQSMNWHAGVFQTVNHDDIYFLPTEEGPGLSPGYFSNIGKTRRRGLELSLDADYQQWSWFMNYSWIEAEFLNSFEVNAENNPAAIAFGIDELSVEKGNSIPSIPKHTLKWGVDWNVSEKFAVGFDAVYNSSQYFRGDEANASSKVGGYTVFNLHGRYAVTNNLDIFARVDNVFDREYETFGLYGEPDEAPGFGVFTDTRFYGAGAPRGAWVGVKLKL
ncbi:MAG: TonB-dependent receptor [Cycloclasticus sp. symbiont of Bathymodiolus heckerae]|nr:MAG: TonB-dependent receptor [Cycloclasticus sp. symbiont of Bathymodiolus heckerae]